jgi:hypothetical protein
MTLSEQATKQVDVLLASYRALKDEIARRSALQWAILAGYAFLLYNAFSAILKPELRLAERIAWTPAAWVTSVLSLLFHRREQLEIMRLSRIISKRIAQRLKDAGFGEMLFERWGLADDDQASSLAYNRRRTECWDGIFDISIFFLGPTGLSMIVAVEVIPERLGLLVAAAVTVILVAAVGIGYIFRPR